MQGTMISIPGRGCGSVSQGSAQTVSQLCAGTCMSVLDFDNITGEKNHCCIEEEEEGGKKLPHTVMCMVKIIAG